MTFPRTSQALRERLTAAGLAPRRRHGQHFLTDVQAVDAIVRDAEIDAADTVIEVGTGPGLLTHALAQTGARVTSFDVDADLQAFAEQLGTWPDTVRFVHADVMADKRTLSPAFRAAFEAAKTGRTLLVSNLPYNIATPLLLAVLGLARPPASITVLVQRELGEKLIASQGTVTRGAPSVVCDVAATGRVLRRFPPNVFWPRPRVESAVLRLDPRQPSPWREGEAARFSRFVVALFTRRRKHLRTGLATATGLSVETIDAVLAEQGVSTSLRPQDVDGHTLLALFRAFDEGVSGGS